MPAQVEQRRISVTEYHKMAKAGILKPDERVELLAGKIICMSPTGSKHAATIDKASELLRALLTHQAIIRVQSPVKLDEFSEPEPDISILVRREDYYANAHPHPEEIYWLIELADSSINYDKEEKSVLYADANIQSLWVIDIAKKCIEVYNQPGDKGFQRQNTFTSGDRLELPAFGSLVKVDDLIVS